ncbi:MAG TPA: hypothetical protein VGG25_16760 [Streptosporangiaceae bacterium]|jgi:hypothetical protein
MFLTRSDRYEYWLYRRACRRRRRAVALAIVAVLAFAALAHHQAPAARHHAHGPAARVTSRHHHHRHARDTGLSTGRPAQPIVLAATFTAAPPAPAPSSTQER